MPLSFIATYILIIISQSVFARLFSATTRPFAPTYVPLVAFLQMQQHTANVHNIAKAHKTIAPPERIPTSSRVH